VQPEDDFDIAVERWLEWGRKKGILVEEPNRKRARS
jgi:hypothetical protein